MRQLWHRSANWLLLVVAGLIGLGMNAAPVAPSPGRWEADSARAMAAESAAIVAYLVAYPRTGDRISMSLYLALAESEDAWAAMYLDRQALALARAAKRLDRQGSNRTTGDHHIVQDLLLHYQRMVAAGWGGANAFALLLNDQIGPQLRERALRSFQHAR